MLVTSTDKLLTKMEGAFDVAAGDPNGDSGIGAYIGTKDFVKKGNASSLAAVMGQFLGTQWGKETRAKMKEVAEQSE